MHKLFINVWWIFMKIFTFLILFKCHAVRLIFQNIQFVLILFMFAPLVYSVIHSFRSLPSEWSLDSSKIIFP